MRSLRLSSHHFCTGSGLISVIRPEPAHLRRRPGRIQFPCAQNGQVVSIARIDYSGHRRVSAATGSRSPATHWPGISYSLFQCYNEAVVNYRRNKTANPDEIYFLTIVTKERFPWIEGLHAYNFLLSEMKRLARLLRFRFKAWVILPDHLHWLIIPVNNDYSDIVSAFKRGVGAELKRAGVLKKGVRLWQDRFWESTVRDDAHYERCIDYIHYNPVRHGIVTSPSEWRHSSFHSHVKRGLYPVDWSSCEVIRIRGSEYD